MHILQLASLPNISTVSRNNFANANFLLRCLTSFIVPDPLITRNERENKYEKLLKFV